MPSILFVCTGNICRSPTADALCRVYMKKHQIEGVSDSCGTHGYHIGEAPDPRTIAAAKKKGVDMSTLRARKLNHDDFERFDYLIAMDQGHMNIMERMTSKPEHLSKMKLLLDYTEHMQGMDVFDPYYGDLKGFDECFDLIDQGVNALLARIL